MNRILMGLFLLSTLCFSVFPCVAADTASLKVGVARVDVTPQEPVQMSGYASRKGLSTGIHDPLTARAFVFESNGSRLVLVSVDVIGWYGDTAEPLREAILQKVGLQPSQLFLAAIHTHSAPSLGFDPERVHANNVKYTQALKEKLPALVASAVANLQPATLAIGSGSSPVGVNRRELRIGPKSDSSIVLGRNPYGPTDKEVLVLRALRADGTPLAVVFDYATHGTSLGADNYVISGDVLGIAEQVVEKISDSGGQAAAFAGASGNIDPWFRILPAFNNEPGWVPETELLGRLLGQEVVHIYRKAAAEVVPPGEIRTISRVLQLPAKPTSETDTATARLPLTITVARLGDVAFVGLGGEVLTEIGQAIKAGSPCRRTFVITHCNGAAGYLAPGHLYVEGGYEVKTTPFGPDAADTVVREALGMLHDLF